MRSRGRVAKPEEIQAVLHGPTAPRGTATREVLDLFIRERNRPLRLRELKCVVEHRLPGANFRQIERDSVTRSLKALGSDLRLRALPWRKNGKSRRRRQEMDERYYQLVVEAPARKG